MKKSLPIVFICLSLIISGAAFCVEDLDDLKDPLKDIQRDLELQRQQQKYQDLQRQKDILSPQQPVQQFPKAPTEIFDKDLALKDKPVTDKAVLKNEEKLKEMMDAQKKKVNTKLDDWRLKIPSKFRAIIEFIAFALFISLFSFIWYRRRVIQKIKEGELG